MTPSSETPAEGPELTAREIAELVDGRLDGPGDVVFRGVAPLEEAAPDELGLLADRRYLDRVDGTGAGGLLVSEELVSDAAAREGAPDVRIVVGNAHRALVPLLDRLRPPEKPEPGVHPTAVLGRGVELGEDVHVGPYAVLGEGVRLGDRVRIGAHVTLGAGSVVGDDCRLHPQVVLYPGSVLGRRVILHAGVRVGVDGYGYVTVDGEHRKVPQVGRCVIEDDVEIGANCTLDRGSIGETVVGKGVKLDNLVHLGHNVRVGDGSMLVAQVGVAGSTRIGKGVLCGGQSGMSGHLTVGDGARLSGRAGVIGDVEPGQTVSGFPAREHREFLKATASLRKVPELRSRVRELEKRLERLEEDAGAEG